MACATNVQVRRTGYPASAATASRPGPSLEAIPRSVLRASRAPETGVLRKGWLCGLFDLRGQQARSENSSRGCQIQPRALPQRTPEGVRGRCEAVRPSKSGGRPHRALALPVRMGRRHAAEQQERSPADSMEAPQGDLMIRRSS